MFTDEFMNDAKYMNRMENRFFHIRFIDSEGNFNYYYDLSFDKTLNLIRKNSKFSYVICGSIENIDRTLKHFNMKDMETIIGCYLIREDIFKIKLKYFVDYTKYFKKKI